jgi:hypothetical protein
LISTNHHPTLQYANVSPNILGQIIETDDFDPEWHYGPGTTVTGISVPPTTGRLKLVTNAAPS